VNKIKIAFISLFITTVLTSCIFVVNNNGVNDQNLTQRELVAVMHGYSKCWIVNNDTKAIAVKMYLNLEPDGSITDIQLIKSDSERYIKDKVFKKAVDNAENAVKKCSPNTALPKEKYKIWKDLLIVFDPSGMKP